MLITRKRKALNDWNDVKGRIHSLGRIPDIHEGEVWWCAVGENVGIEINGKGSFFTRPVIVLKKFSCYGFLGVPLTSQNHVGNWYKPFVLKDRCENAVLSQVRVFSVFRLYQKIGTLPEPDFDEIKDALVKLLV